MNRCGLALDAAPLDQPLGGVQIGVNVTVFNFTETNAGDGLPMHLHVYGKI